MKTRIPLLVFGWLSLGVFVCVLLISFFLMPTYVSLFLHAESGVFAASELFFAFGALSSGFIARHLWTGKHEVIRTLIYFGIGAIVLIIFSFNKNLLIFYFVNILFGFCNASIRYCRVSFFWKVIPNQIMGRVSSVLNLSSYILRAFWGFVFTLSFFEGERGIQFVMLTLFLFVLCCGGMIFKYRRKLIYIDRN